MSDGIRGCITGGSRCHYGRENSRSRNPLEAALHAAETGHLVWHPCIHSRAVMAVHRMISLFPGEQQEGGA